MNDLYLNGEVSDICSTSYQLGHGSSDFNLMENQLYKRNDVANFDAEWRTLDFISETIGLFSSMDCIFGRLMNLTCYISHQFIHFIEDLVFRDINGYSDFPEDKFYRKNITSSTNCSSTSSKFGNVGTRSRSCEKVVHDFEEEAHVNTRPDIVQINHSYLSISSLFQGLMLPLFGFRLAWRLVCASWRCYFCYLRRAQVRVQSIISRVQKTLRGSADDIGWLQDSPGMAPVTDGTPKFTELLQGIRNGVHKLPNSYVYLLIPGLFSNHGPLYFVNTKRFFSKMGLTCHIAKIHSEASVERNALELKQYIEELHWGSGKRVMLLGHSKGGVDAAAALSIYSSELKDKVAGLALVQSPYGGTPLASDILREGQIADKETRRIMEFFICKIIKGDIRALEDLTYEKRKEFIMKHKLPEQIPLISFHSEANIAPGVIATMTHIAHAELPWFPLFGRENESEDFGQAAFTVSVKLPVSAAMAVCALHLQLRYGEKSDGLVTCRDAEVPGSVVVRPNRKLDHAWMVYSSMRKDHNDPDASEMCEALLTMLVELGKIKKASH